MKRKKNPMKPSSFRSTVVKASRESVLKVTGVPTRDHNALELLIEELTKDVRRDFESQMRAWLLETDRYIPFSNPEVEVTTEVLSEPTASFDASKAVTRQPGQTKVVVSMRAHLL